MSLAEAIQSLTATARSGTRKEIEREIEQQAESKELASRGAVWCYSDAQESERAEAREGCQ